MLALILGVCFASHCEATVYYSNGRLRMAGFDDAALNGDTITLPAGTFTWANGVKSGKASRCEAWLGCNNNNRGSRLHRTP